MRLDADFEAKLARAIRPDREEMEALGDRMMAIAEEKWREYAAANDYDIEHIWTDAEITHVDIRDRGASVRVEWPFSAQFEFGVDPHVIEATNAEVLKFPWPDGPDEVLADFEPLWNDPDHFLEEPEVLFPKVNWGSETGGIPKARAVRGMLMEIRQELRD